MITPIVAFSIFSEGSSGFCLKHDFNVDELGSTSLNPGVNVDVGEVIKFFNTFQPKKNNQGFLPENLIFDSNGWLGWIVEPSVKTLNFKINSSKSFSLSVPMPRILMFVKDKKIRAFAIKDKKLTLDTEIFNVPLMNFYSVGDMCLGSVKLPHAVSVDNFSEWESAVFSSFFTHVNNDKTFKSKEPVDSMMHISFWRSLVGNKRFKNSLLSFSGMKFMDLITMLEGV